MKEIRLTKLTKENFEEYGTYTDLLNPRHPFYEAGQPQFYPDRTTVAIGKEGNLGISVSQEFKRDNVIEFAEIHQKTEEAMVCLDDDVIIYCAPATETKELPLDYVQAFFIPKGTLVTIKPGVWHGCQFLQNLEVGHVLVLLPERTYAKDCVLVELKEDDQIRIVAE